MHLPEGYPPSYMVYCKRCHRLSNKGFDDVVCYYAREVLADGVVYSSTHTCKSVVRLDEHPPPPRLLLKQTVLS